MSTNPPGYQKPKMKKSVQYALLGVAVFAGVFGVKAAMDGGLIPTPGFLKPAVPEASGTLAGDVNDGVPREAYELAAQPATGFQGCARVMTIPWNATSGLSLANGGPRTARNSLVEEYSGGCLSVERQDDYTVIRENLVKFDKDYRGGQTLPAAGVPMAIIMGDGLPAFAQALQGNADVVVVGVVGFSYGEDKCMGRPLNGDFQKMRGSLIAAVPMDGDQNICLKLASDNGVPVNTGPGYDPQAVNFLDTASFVEADERYTTGFCEERQLIVDGRLTEERKRVCVDGVATWTPGDVVVTKNKGGLESWASTREYNQQMPAILIANRRWAAENKAYVVGLLRAADRAAFQIRSEDGSFLQKAGLAMSQIHGGAGGDEADPAFWSRYYVGEDFTDRQGNTVRLGGSRVSTLAEVRDFLGLGTGTLNIYKGVYEIFGNYAKAFYPNMLSEYPAYDSIVTGEYVQAALAGVQTTSTGPAAFERNTSIQDVRSSRPYSIEFETGSARITPSSSAQLRELAGQSGMTNLRILIEGHTDNVGNPALNMSLSRQRAEAVANWLKEAAPATFPENRIQVRGYGDTQPKGDNSTPAGQRTNRRVEVTLGN